MEPAAEEFGDDSPVHRTSQRWVKRGVLPRLWAVLVEGCEAPGALTGSGRAPTAPWARPGTGDQVGANPTDGAKNGTKRGVLTEADGGPVAVFVAPANRHDSMILRGRLRLRQDILEAVVVEPPAGSEQHLCLDAAFVGAGCDATARVSGYEPHVRPIGEERAAAQGRRTKKRHKPRRWVVELTISWLNRCRGILVRYEKAENYLGAVQLACALLWYRRLHRLTT